MEQLSGGILRFDWYLKRAHEKHLLLWVNDVKGEVVINKLMLTANVFGIIGVIV